MSHRDENLREDIEFDFKRVAKILDELKKFKASARPTDPLLLEVSAGYAASRLERLYSAFEKISEKILILKGRSLPNLTADYHRFLLEEIIANRLIQNPTQISLLTDLMNHWHISRAEPFLEYSYDEIEEKVNKVFELWPAISTALRQAIQGDKR